MADAPLVATTKNQGSAIIYMLFAVFGISLIPLLISWGGGSESPFLFNAGWRYGVVAGCLLYLIASHRPILSNPAVWSLLRRRVFSWAILLAAIGNLEYLAFAWATQFVDISVATVVYEVWPLFLILLLSQLYKGEKRYREIQHSMVIFLAIAIVGLAFVVASQTGDFSWLGFMGEGNLGTLYGVALALLGAILAPLMAFGFRWGTDLSNELRFRMIPPPPPRLLYP